MEKEIILKRIEEFRKLEDNWDGMCACAPMEKTIDNAVSLVSKLYEFKEDIDIDEDVYPTSYGSVCIDVILDEGVLSIEIGRTQIGCFSDFKERPNVAIEADEWNDDSFEKIKEIIKNEKR